MTLGVCGSRKHGPPNVRKMNELATAAEMAGVTLDASWSGSLHDSLVDLRASAEDPMVAEIIQLLATKPMQVSTPFKHQSYWSG